MKTIDRYGRQWDLPKGELCPKCGQPDTCGDCNHERLLDEEVERLGGTLEPDVEVRNHGTMWTFVLRTEAVRRWVDENVHIDCWQWVGEHAFAGDWRPMRDLACLMLGLGYSFDGLDQRTRQLAERLDD